jgi:hypothetical protein
MHDMITLTYLYAAGIEPRPWLHPPQRGRRRRPTRAALGRLLLATGRILERAGARLSSANPAMAPMEPRSAPG